MSEKMQSKNLSSPYELRSFAKGKVEYMAEWPAAILTPSPGITSDRNRHDYTVECPACFPPTIESPMSDPHGGVPD